jgi:hypothetical protein
MGRRIADAFFVGRKHADESMPLADLPRLQAPILRALARKTSGPAG